MATFPPGVALAVNPVCVRYRARVGPVEEACVDQRESYVSAEGAMGVGMGIGGPRGRPRLTRWWRWGGWLGCSGGILRCRYGDGDGVEGGMRT